MVRLSNMLFVCAIALSASELTGKWQGTSESTNPDGQPQRHTTYLVLKAEDNGLVTGTAGSDARQQTPIRNGKLQQDRITFEVPLQGGGQIAFSLTFDGTCLRGTGTVTYENGQTITGRLQLSRVD